MTNEKTISTWNKVDPKSFDKQVIEHIEGFQPVYMAWRTSEETWSFNEGLDIRHDLFYNLLVGYLTRILTFDGNHLEAYEEAKAWVDGFWYEQDSILGKWSTEWSNNNPNFIPTVDSI